MVKESIDELIKRAREIPKEKKDEFLRCLHEQEKRSRHVEKDTEEIVYRSWKDFDVVQVFAANSPHPLKSVSLGYAYRGDIPCNDKLVEAVSVGTDISKKASKDGVKLTILSYDEASRRAKEIDWKKVRIER